MSAQSIFGRLVSKLLSNKPNPIYYTRYLKSTWLIVLSSLQGTHTYICIHMNLHIYLQPEKDFPQIFGEKMVSKQWVRLFKIHMFRLIILKNRRNNIKAVFLKYKKCCLYLVPIGYRVLAARVLLSLRRKQQISESISARATIFGDNIPIRCTQKPMNNS